MRAHTLPLVLETVCCAPFQSATHYSSNLTEALTATRQDRAQRVSIRHHGALAKGAAEDLTETVTEGVTEGVTKFVPEARVSAGMHARKVTQQSVPRE